MNARPPLFARALKGGAMTAGAYAATQVLRLGTNLILTRLLFPEAFGTLALVMVFLVGFQMFTDTGIGPAISRSARGDAPDFLDTAWTINVARGALLWLLACAVAWPAAWFYDVPGLLWYLPVAGIGLFIAGFSPTRIDTANRHLLLGRVTLLDLIAQGLGMALTIGLAFIFPSVWALVAGFVGGAAIRLTLMWTALPGRPNRLHWDRAAGRELLHFGKWIFASTACGFLMSQGDKAILGAYLTLAQMGVYNIAFFLASFPVLLGGAVTGRILIPLYRDHPPFEPGEFVRHRRMRVMISSGLLAMLAVLALCGPWIVQVLYDDRYLAAGGIVTAIALVQMIPVIGMTYDQSALAADDSRSYFAVMAIRAGLQTGGFLIGAAWGGLEGALVGQALAFTLSHGAIVWLARRHRAWDRPHDLLAGTVVALMIVAIGWWHRDLLMVLHV
jgi:O-antigen/teichoic acid export membrane protein